MKVKRLFVREGLDGEIIALATFRMDGDQLSVDWHSDHFRAQVEEFGISALDVETGEVKQLRTSQGKAFFDGLEAAYGRNIMMMLVPSEE
jgi:hypothetical protein